MLTRGDLPPMMLPSTLAGDAVTPRRALAVADAYAAVRRLADTAASLPLHVFRRSADGGRGRAENETDALLRNPAPAVTQAAFVAQLVSHLCLFGEGVIAKYRPEGRGSIDQLGLIAPDRVHVELRGGMPFYGISTEDGRYGVHTTADIIHVKGLSIDGLRGISPVRQMAQALGHASALAEHGARFMANGARPSGILSVGGGVHADEQIEALKLAWEDRHRGSDNAGKVALLTGEVSFEAVSMPLAEAQFLEQREFSTAEVARIFGLWPWMIGGKTGDSLTYSTVAEQLRAFAMFSLRPLLVVIEQALGQDADLFPPEASTYCAFDLDHLLKGDAKTRSEVYARALDPVTGWMRRDEVRRIEDLPAEPDREEIAADA